MELNPRQTINSTMKNTVKMYSKHMGSIISPFTPFAFNGGLPRGKFKLIFEQSAVAEFGGL